MHVADAVDHWVYKVSNHRSELLYVGITHDGPRRMRAYARASEWAPRASCSEIEREAVQSREALSPLSTSAIFGV